MMVAKGIPARRKGMILILSAPSGAGKTTLIQRILRIFPDLRLSVSYTTRSPRAREIPGKDYRFVSERKFLAMRGRGEFAEWANVHGSLYGTPRMALERAVRRGRDILLDIDVEGSKKIQKRYPHSVSVFLLPPSWKELERRLSHRGTDRREVIRQRLERARRELKEIGRYDYCIMNHEIHRALESLKAIVFAERLKVLRVERWTVPFLLRNKPRGRPKVKPRTRDFE